MSFSDFGPQPDELDAVNHGVYLAAAIPEIDVELNRQIENALRRISQKLGAGTLTPNEAMAICCEIHAYRQAGKRLKRRVREAQSMGARIAPDMEIGE